MKYKTSDKCLAILRYLFNGGILIMELHDLETKETKSCKCTMINDQFGVLDNESFIGIDITLSKIIEMCNNMSDKDFNDMLINKNLNEKINKEKIVWM